MELRPASSVAHTYGKNPVFAEAFTGGPRYTSTPWSLKKRGDWAYCQGINQYVLHVYIHQPRDDRKPGMNSWFGTEFNRNNTWFEATKSWIDYQRRCSVLLQQGQQVADVAYFIGEDAPRAFGARKPELPPGYDFDYINSEVLMTRAAVRDGRLVLASGMSYKLLVLPAQDTMTPEMLEKIATFVKAGLAVYGPRPVRSPSLKGYPACDKRLETLAGELWGKGLVIPGGDLKKVLEKCQTSPDLADVDPQKILFTHRRTSDADFYFLSNQTDESLDISPTFRVIGRAPELWYPDTGIRESLAVYDVGATSTLVPLRLEARGSVFVVFRGKNRKPEAKRQDKAKNWVEYQPLQILTGPWQVTFPGVSEPVPFEHLKSWTEHANATVKYFSGTASYRKTFDFQKSQMTNPKSQICLDLGRVESLAEVTLNGKNLGWLWKAPHRVDVTDVIKPGVNVLHVNVVNTWHNRLVGQKQEPEAFSASDVFKPWLAEQFDPGKELYPSGLLGPVQIVTGPQVR